jgi:Fe-Mn family superoxide dismutase
MTSSKVLADSVLKAAVNLHPNKLPSKLIKSSSALFSAYGGKKQELPDLPYDYNALQPAISAETMTIHHTKHHATYVNNLNAALEKLDGALSTGDVSGIIAIQGALKFNGGGHLNHTLFWENLGPASSGFPGGDLNAAIIECFDSLDGLKQEMSAKTIAIQGRYVNI